LRVAEVSFSSFGGYALFIAVALVVTGRALAVYPISWLFSRTRFPIPYPDQHVLWWGGLRGGLAIALSLSLPDSLLMHDQIVTATFAVVVFSVLVQGLSMPLVLKRLHLRGQ